MLKMIARLFRSFTRFLMGIEEDPEEVLQQNIGKMEEQQQKMNERIAMIRTEVRLMENRKNELENNEKELTGKIQAELKAGKRDNALELATTLERLREERRAADDQFNTVSESYDRASKLKHALTAKIEEKKKEAMSAIRTLKRGEWEKELADIMETFQAEGIDATQDEAVRKIEDKSAEGKAKVRLTLNSPENQDVEFEEEARKLQADQIVEQLEAEMGLAQTEGPTPSEKFKARQEEQPADPPETGADRE